MTNALKAPWKIENVKGTFNIENMKLDQNQLLRFTTAGSVDDGKSTLIGRLLYKEPMAGNEACLVHNVRRLVAFSGTQHAAVCRGADPRAPLLSVVAADPLRVAGDEQLSELHIARDLLKATAAAEALAVVSCSGPGSLLVAGLWGTGPFHGKHFLLTALQLVAAVAVGRSSSSASSSGMCRSSSSASSSGMCKGMCLQLCLGKGQEREAKWLAVVLRYLRSDALQGLTLKDLATLLNHRGAEPEPKSILVAVLAKGVEPAAEAATCDGAAPAPAPPTSSGSGVVSFKRFATRTLKRIKALSLAAESVAAAADAEPNK